MKHITREKKLKINSTNFSENCMQKGLEKDFTSRKKNVGWFDGFLLNIFNFVD